MCVNQITHHSRNQHIKTTEKKWKWTNERSNTETSASFLAAPPSIDRNVAALVLNRRRRRRYFFHRIFVFFFFWYSNFGAFRMKKKRNFSRRWISGWCVIRRLLLTSSIIIIVPSWMCSVCRQKLKNKMNHYLSIIISSFCSSISSAFASWARICGHSAPLCRVMLTNASHFDVQNVCAFLTSWGVVRWNIA